MTEMALGVFTLVLFVVHVTAGEKECARPMLAADYDATARWTMYVCWHAISAHLLLGGGALLWAGATDSAVVGPVLVAVISTLRLVYAALFLVLAFVSRIERGWLKLPQWMGFLPLGLIGWWAALS